MKLKCIIVDDEPRAIEVLVEYVEQLSSLELLATFRNPIKAFDFVKQNQVDVIFLDINMPNLSGIQFIKSLTHKPAIVLTTAYSEYAIESYQLDVLDYLLKPIEFERFIKCMDRLMEKLTPKETSQISSISPNIQTNTQETLDYIFVKHGTKIERIELDDILYIEGSGNYVSYHLENKNILALGKMTEAFEALPQERFIRIHKSYIVQWNKIKYIEDNHVLIGKAKLSISSTYKNDFFDKIKNL